MRCLQSWGWMPRRRRRQRRPVAAPPARRPSARPRRRRRAGRPTAPPRQPTAAAPPAPTAARRTRCVVWGWPCQPLSFLPKLHPRSAHSAPCPPDPLLPSRRSRLMRRRRRVRAPASTPRPSRPRRRRWPRRKRRRPRRRRRRQRRPRPPRPPRRGPRQPRARTSQGTTRCPRAEVAAEWHRSGRMSRLRLPELAMVAGRAACQLTHGWLPSMAARCCRLQASTPQFSPHAACLFGLLAATLAAPREQLHRTNTQTQCFDFVSLFLLTGLLQQAPRSCFSPACRFCSLCSHVHQAAGCAHLPGGQCLPRYAPCPSSVLLELCAPVLSISPSPVCFALCMCAACCTPLTHTDFSAPCRLPLPGKVRTLPPRRGP